MKFKSQYILVTNFVTAGRQIEKKLRWKTQKTKTKYRKYTLVFIYGKNCFIEKSYSKKSYCMLILFDVFSMEWYDNQSISNWKKGKIGLIQAKLWFSLLDSDFNWAHYWLSYYWIQILTLLSSFQGFILTMKILTPIIG